MTVGPTELLRPRVEDGAVLVSLGEALFPEAFAFWLFTETFKEFRD